MPVPPSPTSSMFLKPLCPATVPYEGHLPGGKGIVGSPDPSSPVLGLPAVAHDSTLGERVGEACGEPKHHHIALPEVPDLLLLHIHIPDVTEQDHHCGRGKVSSHVPRPPCTSRLDADTVALGTQWLWGHSAEDQSLLVMKECVSLQVGGPEDAGTQP